MFQHADDYLPDLPEPTRRFRLSRLLQVLTAVCLLFSLLNAIQVVESRPGARPIWLIVNLILAGMVLLWILSWLAVALVRSLQWQSRRKQPPQR